MARLGFVMGYGVLLKLIKGLSAWSGLKPGVLGALFAAVGAGVLASGWLWAVPAAVSAQLTEEELHQRDLDRACHVDPASEKCVCGTAVADVGWMPKSYHSVNRLRGKDIDNDGEYPTLNQVTGVWEGTKDYEFDGIRNSDGDLVLKKNDLYDEQCSFAYLREDLRRVWRFVIALGTLLLGGSLAWIGFVYMQESAQIGNSGSGWAGSRTLLMRVLVGIFVLALAGVIWDFIADFTLPGVDSWTLRRDKFYFFER